MSFIAQKEEKSVTTTTGKKYKLHLIEQESGQWLYLILHANTAGVVSIHQEIKSDKTDAYYGGVEWILNNIDNQAIIESL